MIPTEQEGTLAVDAAAKKAYEVAYRNEKVPDWGALPRLEQNTWREIVLNVVWAGLEALPDRRAAAWQEGHDAACSAGSVCSTHQPKYREE